MVKYGSIKITSSPSGAEVLYDGKSVSPKEYTDTNWIWLPPAKYEITLRKSGYKDYKFSIAVKEGGSKKYSAILVKGAAAPAPTPAPTAPVEAAPIRLGASSELDKEIPGWQQKIMRFSDWLWPVNAVSKLLFGKNIKGEKEEFGSAGDYIDLAAAVVMILPFGKIVGITEKVGAKAGSKGLLSLSEKLLAKKAGKEITEEVGKAAMKQVAKEGIALSSAEAKGLAVTMSDLYTRMPKDVVASFKLMNTATQKLIIEVLGTTTQGRIVASDILKSVVRAADITLLKKAAPWLAAAVGVMGSANFVEFLYEEGLQTAGMGIYVAIANKQWDTAKKALDKAKPLLAQAEWVYNYLGWMAPYAWNVFRNYAKATRSQYETYEKVIAEKSGEIKDPTAAGKVFDIEEAKKNIENGTAPDVDKLIARVIISPEKIVKARSITDGDTILALLPNEAIESKIRLAGIDAPEKGKTGYKESRAWLETQILGSEVTLKIDPANAKDSYGRVIAVIMKNGEDINLKSVRAGWSTYYPYLKNKFVDDAAYRAAQDEAKAANLGIYGLAAAVTMKAEEKAGAVITPEVPEAEKEKITDVQTLWDKMKEFYTGRMYMSKKELTALKNKYSIEGEQVLALLADVESFYTGRMYMSKKEMAGVAQKYGLS